MGISIAITGKGGTGKTVVATLLIRLLSRECKLKVLAIDADSASSLPYTLGLDVKKTISQLRKEVTGYNNTTKEIDHQPIEDLLKPLITHGPGFDLLAMGRPEEPGCFCAVNNLLRYGIDALVDDYDIVIIDGEAGPEQLNRRVMSKIDYLFTIADMSYRSFQTAKGIQEIAKKSEDGIQVDHPAIILNRVRESNESIDYLDDIEVIGNIPEDSTLNKYDRDGRSLLDLPDDAPVVKAVREILVKAITM